VWLVWGGVVCLRAKLLALTLWGKEVPGPGGGAAILGPPLVKKKGSNIPVLMKEGVTTSK